METTLFNRNGVPVAYIAEGTNPVIYSFDGTALGHIIKECIYNLAGKHLGWFKNHMMFDTRGHRVGYTAQNSPNLTFAEPAKKEKNQPIVNNEIYRPAAEPTFSKNQSAWDLKYIWR